MALDLAQGNTHRYRWLKCLPQNQPLDRQHLAAYRLQVELLNDQICEASVHILAEGIALQPALSASQGQAPGGSGTGRHLGCCTQQGWCLQGQTGRRSITQGATGSQRRECSVLLQFKGRWRVPGGRCHQG